MELLEVILELMIWLLDGGTLIADIHAWWKGRENRLERREARKAGDPLPPRDKWSRRVVVLTVSFLALTTTLIFWKL